MPFVHVYQRFIMNRERVSSDIVWCALQNLKRPFSPMKELDMDKVVKDIIKKLKC